MCICIHNRIARAIMLGLIAASLLMSAACGRSDAPPAAPIRIGAYYWPGFYWVDIAHQQGWFREVGLNVEWVDTNADYFASFNDFYAGKFDVVAFT